MNHTLNKLNAFGCPWHGLIEGGQLTLPNGLTMPMRQPNGLPFERGNTHLIDLPTAPITTRTTEQQEADTLTGLQWLDKAIISGDQIHGQVLGAGRWIYHSDGNWLVSTTLQGSVGSITTCTVTLKRFGVFGGDPLEYAYEVAVPSLAAEYGYWSLSPGASSLHLYSAHPQGSAGMFALLGQWSGLLERRPIAWVEVTLSGPASACVIGITLARSADQTAGTVTNEDNFRDMFDTFTQHTLLSAEAVESTFTSDPCGGYIRRTVAATAVTGAPVGDRLLFYRDTVGSFVVRSTFTGCILGLVYSPAGSLVEITLDADSTVNVSAPAPQVITAQDYIYDVSYAPSGSECVGTPTQEQSLLFKIKKTTTTNNTASLNIKVGGATVINKSANYDYVESVTLTVHKATPGQTETPASREFERSWSCSPGGTNSFYLNEFLDPGEEHLLFQPGEGLQVYPSESVRNPGYYAVDWYTAPGVFSYYQEQAARHSNGVYSIETLSIPGFSFPELFSYSGGVATPAGLVAVPDQSATRDTSNDPLPFLFGSYNPITGEAVRSESPVCWT